MTRIPTAQSPRNTRTASTPAPPSGVPAPSPAAPAAAGDRKFYQRGEVLAVIGLGAVLIELVLFFLLGWWALAINAVLALGGTAGYQAIKRKNPGWLRKLWPGRNGGPRLFSGGRRGPALFNSRPGGSPASNPLRRLFSRSPGSKPPGTPGARPTLGQRLGLRSRTPALATSSPAKAPGRGLFGRTPRTPNRSNTAPSRTGANAPTGTSNRRSQRGGAPEGGAEKKRFSRLREWFAEAQVCPRCGHDRREDGCGCTAFACRCRGTNPATAAQQTDSKPQAANAAAPAADGAKKPPVKPAAAVKPDSRWTKCGQCGHGMVVIGCKCTDPDCFCIYQDELPTPPPQQAATGQEPPSRSGVPAPAQQRQPQQEEDPEPLPEPKKANQPRHAAPAPEPGHSIRGGKGMKRRESLQGYVKGTKEWETGAAEVAAAYAKAEAARDAYLQLSGSLIQQGLTEMPATQRVKAELEDFANRSKATPDSAQGWRSTAAAAAALSAVAFQEHDVDLRRADGERAPTPIEANSDVRVAASDG